MHLLEQAIRLRTDPCVAGGLRPILIPDARIEDHEIVLNHGNGADDLSPPRRVKALKSTFRRSWPGIPERPNRAPAGFGFSTSKLVFAKAVNVCRRAFGLVAYAPERWPEYDACRGSTMRLPVAAILVGISMISVIPLRRACAAEQALPEDAVVQVERQWLQAFHDKDRETLNKLMPDNFMVTTPIGEVLGKSKLVPPDHSVQALPKYKLVAPVAQIYGDVAVLMGRLVDDDGEQLSTTSVFKRKGDGWVIIAAQLTPLPAK